MIGTPSISMIAVVILDDLQILVVDRVPRP